MLAHFAGLIRGSSAIGGCQHERTVLPSLVCLENNLNGYGHSLLLTYAVRVECKVQKGTQGFRLRGKRHVSGPRIAGFSVGKVTDTGGCCRLKPNGFDCKPPLPSHEEW